MRKILIIIILLSLTIISSNAFAACSGMYQDDYGRWLNCAGGNIYGDSNRNPMADPTRNPMADPTRNPMADPFRNPLADPSRNPLADPNRSLMGDTSQTSSW
jgi:hypothetical protein|tara:strand:- start:397 stop:702 length:306 start_codon:yes stop_codon:yes gene_type:complete